MRKCRSAREQGSADSRTGQDAGKERCGYGRGNDDSGE
ncbi:MAG: hypothetical protein MJZ29_10570 [Bacteroidaceae bacterium]|nr:hypothetical protein [Bacteroidaceae bacterium]